MDLLKVTRTRVSSIIQEALYTKDLMAEQVQRSLQGETEHKIMGFGPRTPLEQILKHIDFMVMMVPLVGNEYSHGPTGLSRTILRNS